MSDKERDDGGGKKEVSGERGGERYLSERGKERASERDEGEGKKEVSGGW